MFCHQPALGEGNTNLWYQEEVLHWSSIWIRPFLESIRWYLSLILLLLTTSPRFITTYPRVSWYREKENTQSSSCSCWNIFRSIIKILYYTLGCIFKPIREVVLMTSTCSLSFMGGSSNGNWKSSSHLGSLFFFTRCISNQIYIKNLGSDLRIKGPKTFLDSS